MSDEHKLRLGVIGADAWASFAHIPGFLRRPEIEPWVVNRRDLEALTAIRSRFGFAHATTDWREVIDLRPDIVADRTGCPSRCAGEGRTRGGYPRRRREAVHHRPGGRLGDRPPRP